MKRSQAEGFSNQQALLVLVLAFPLGLIGLGILASIGMSFSRPEPQGKAPATEAPSVPAPPAEPIHRQPKQPVSTSPAQDPIDALADEIFWRRHPSLRGVKLTNQQGELANEWAAIRRCEAIVDDRFYQHFPQMRGRTIEPGNTAMIQIWTAIRDQVPGCS